MRLFTEDIAEPRNYCIRVSEVFLRPPILRRTVCSVEENGLHVEADRPVGCSDFGARSQRPEAVGGPLAVGKEDVLTVFFPRDHRIEPSLGADRATRARGVLGVRWRVLPGPAWSFVGRTAEGTKDSRVIAVTRELSRNSSASWPLTSQTSQFNIKRIEFLYLRRCSPGVG
jgi:hypothetical protein